MFRPIKTQILRLLPLRTGTYKYRFAHLVSLVLNSKLKSPPFLSGNKNTLSKWMYLWPYYCWEQQKLVKCSLFSPLRKRIPMGFPVILMKPFHHLVQASSQSSSGSKNIERDRRMKTAIILGCFSSSGEIPATPCPLQRRNSVWQHNVDKEAGNEL